LEKILESCSYKQLETFPKIKEIKVILILERHYISSQHPVTDLGKWKHVFLRAKVISPTSELGPKKQTRTHCMNIKKSERKKSKAGSHLKK
jgi:hypothetical protein